jgi:hypothetical protein
MSLSVYLGAKSAEDNILDTEKQSPVQAADNKICLKIPLKLSKGTIDKVKMIKIFKLKVSRTTNVFSSVVIVNPQCGSGSSFLPKWGSGSGS